MSIEQKQICDKYNMPYQATDLNLKIGISRNFKNTREPIHGLRIKEENGTSGWYFWRGEWSDDPDFFIPLHGYHLDDWSKLILPYLGLPEGSRFIIENNYEDIWFDENLLPN